jgi:hypothetical protein
MCYVYDTNNITSNWYYDIEYTSIMVVDYFDVYFCEVCGGGEEDFPICCMGNFYCLWVFYGGFQLFW